MAIDIRTLILIIGITHLMQVIVFAHQFKVNKHIFGPGWWLMWSAAEFLGFGLILLRTLPSLLIPVIIFQNIIILFGTIFIYIGILKFFDQKINLKFILSLCLSYIIIHLFFVFINDNINLRTLFFDIYISGIAFITAFCIYKYKNKSLSSTAYFNIILFTLHGLIFAYRAIMIATGTQVLNVYSTSVFNLVQYFDALIVALLWTFGFIIMLNQKLNSEITEANTHFEQIFNTSPDAAAITRLSDGMIVDCNESYERISGYAKGEIVGKTTLDIDVWKNPADRLEAVRLLTDHGFYENLEFMFKRKDGEIITGLMSSKVISLKGVPHIISLTRNISERKRIEAEIQLQNQELQKLNAEKDKFFSIISHDLKSPFNSIIGFSDLLVEQAREKNFEGIEQFADIILESSHRAMDLLTNLMEWSRSQTGRMIFNPEFFEMVNLVNEVVLLLKDTAEQKSISINKIVPSNAPVFADKDMISTVLRNLISNAIKFTIPGGDIIIKIVQKSNEILVSIIDTGVGIPKDIQKELFNIDQNYSTAGTNNEKGTGLGLILCNDFIAKHGGKLWVESEVGRGSTFYFTLPNNKIIIDSGA